MAGKIRTVSVRVTANISDFEKKMRTVSKSMGKIGSQLANAGKSMTMGITVPLTALGTVMTKTAMNMESSLNQVKNNLGTSSQAVLDWVDTQAKAFNMAKVDATKYAATFSNLLGNFLNQSQTADFTKALLQQSSVMANKTGRSVEDVMERIRSGLLGNTESIEDLGINVNVAMLESTEAFKKFAGNKSWEKLSFQTQQQIRLFAILEQSTKRYGTSIDQSTASSMQGMIARAKDLALAFGTKLLPAFGKLLDFGNKILDWINGLSDSMKTNIVVVASLAAAIGPVTLVIGKLITTISGAVSGLGMLASMANPVTAAMAAIVVSLGLVAGGLIYLYNTNEDVKYNMISAWQQIQSGLEQIGDQLRVFWGNWGDEITAVFTTVTQSSIALINGALTALNGFLGGVSKIWNKDLSGIADIVNTPASFDKGYKESLFGKTGPSSSSTWGWYAKANSDKANIESTKRAKMSGVDIAKLLNNTDKFANKGTTTYKKLNDNIKEFVSNIKEQTKAYMDFASLFDKVNYQQAISGERWINRLKGQVKAMTTYQQSLSVIQAKMNQGLISKGLFEELKGLGIGGAKQLQAVAKMTNAQLSQANNLYGQKSSIAGTLAYNDVMAQRGQEKSLNQIIINITGNKIEDEDEIADKIIKKLKVAGAI